MEVIDDGYAALLLFSGARRVCHNTLTLIDPPTPVVVVLDGPLTVPSHRRGGLHRAGQGRDARREMLRRANAMKRRL